MQFQVSLNCVCGVKALQVDFICSEYRIKLFQSYWVLRLKSANQARPGATVQFMAILTSLLCFINKYQCFYNYILLTILF